ncbi:hypothetical protein KBY72_12655 [Cyanobium sp. BA5m-21]|uniref:hypothetical protein n=1 Tax=unclassified Cyanobium TaxID=2627006 RepID=UPI0020CBF69E|nr:MULTISPECIES: hypothetical protein [unclassified Cyanobium]MCP9905118.1 hypothetical protein [Cyanobium sp. BA5m-10]MCP9908019.1 hypothetical protein [Cyanobium sp. BA5m-21]
MERSALQCRQRQGARDICVWFVWTNSLSAIFLLMAWFYGEAHLVRGVAENLTLRQKLLPHLRQFAGTERVPAAESILTA